MAEDEGVEEEQGGYKKGGRGWHLGNNLIISNLSPASLSQHASQDRSEDKFDKCPQFLVYDPLFNGTAGLELCCKNREPKSIGIME